MDAFGKGGEWKRALSLLEEGLEGSYSGLVDVIGFNAAISACEEAAKWEEALELLKNLQEAEALQADVTLAFIILYLSLCEGEGFTFLDRHTIDDIR